MVQSITGTVRFNVIQISRAAAPRAAGMTPIAPLTEA
jgi:hypothetical protein